MRWYIAFIVVCAASLSAYMYLSNPANPVLQNVATWNVKTDFNAKGDGIHDDTNAIQAAIDDAGKGDTIVIPPGTYKVSKNIANKAVTDYGVSYSALKITKPVTIVMEGATFQTKTQNEYGVFWIYKTNDVALKGGILKGDTLPTSGIYTSRVGVLVQECDHCSIENMSLTNFSQGINVYKSEYSTVRNVTTEFNKGSGIINLASKYSLIDSCTIRNSGDGHLSLFGGGANNTVINSTIEENRPGVLNQQGITLEKEKETLIKNNVVTGFYYGIDIKNGSDSNSIESNTVYNNQYNITIRAGDPGSNGRAISNNIKIIKNMAVNSRKGANTAGIYIMVGSGHQIQENTVDEGTLIIAGGLQLKNNLEFNKNKYVDNIFVKKSK
ncbi:right-handed parallel beta-helix repeat-containing protein [Paenibacillus sepulcri]|uniref:Right-handed parallel beta-helix repeat-containing protein n=2 Tax=Paenibacillus sepulcri TaxID=359917 RepID=A0ABS7BV79_9BACL|nr:right-handed parallel beta-helix repeat-containing protein [Paenibacillus sepulcri]